MQTREDFLPLSLPPLFFIITWPSQEALPSLPLIPVWIRDDKQPMNGGRG